MDEDEDAAAADAGCDDEDQSAEEPLLLLLRTPAADPEDGFVGDVGHCRRGGWGHEARAPGTAEGAAAGVIVG